MPVPLISKDLIRACPCAAATDHVPAPGFARAIRLRWCAALAFIALAALWPPACDAQSHPLPPDLGPSASIWFHPLPAAVDWPGGGGLPTGGSTDFLALFQADSPWPRVMAKTQVMGLYAGWIAVANPEALERVVAFLNARNMAIEIEAPALQALANCGSGVEGYVPYGQSVQTFTLSYLLRLKELGAKRILVKVDEPYFFGSIANDPRSCHFPVEQVAAEVGQYAQLVKAVFPDAAVGDVEPIIDSAYPGGVVASLDQWHQVYRMVAGQPFPFFIADTDFSNPAWPSVDREIEMHTRKSGMRFGIIYIGDPQDASDAEWALKVVDRFYLYQGIAKGRPDFVLFQSWEAHPERCLPESALTTFTGVIDAYIDATR